MHKLLGEYDCKVDSKGRFLFPTGLKKQMEDLLGDGFVVNGDMHEPCLVVYPQSVWDEVSAQVMALNRFVKKNALFIRRFTNGASIMQLDSSGRVLLPKALLERVGLGKEIKLIGSGDRVEIWDRAAYEAMMDEPCDLSELSEEVMGDKGQNNE